MYAYYEENGVLKREQCDIKNDYLYNHYGINPSLLHIFKVRYYMGGDGDFYKICGYIESFSYRQFVVRTDESIYIFKLENVLEMIPITD